MELGTAFVLLVWGALAVSVILRLTRRGARTFDDSFERRDQKLARAAALYLGVPAAVLGSQLAQVALLTARGAGLGHLESWVYFGIVEPLHPERLTHVERAAIAIAAPVTLVFITAAMLAWTKHRPGTAAKNFVRLEVARVLMSLSLGVHPIVSILIERGDYWTMRSELNAAAAPLGDVGLLLGGLIAAFAFWGWRRARALRLLASGTYDATRRAHDLLERSPDDPDALRALAVAQLATGDADAVGTLLHALEIAPEDPRVELLLGQAVLGAGDARAASAHLRRAGQLLEESETDDDPLLFEIALALSAARIALGDAEGAILTAEAAREARPTDPRGVLIFADALVAGGRRDDARSALNVALTLAEGTARFEIERRLAALRPRR